MKVIAKVDKIKYTYTNYDKDHLFRSKNTQHSSVVKLRERFIGKTWKQEDVLDVIKEENEIFQGYQTRIERATSKRTKYKDRAK